MMTKVGINGFGRIGRNVFRAMHANYQDKLEVVALNDLTDGATNAHLLKYDTNYGPFPGKVDVQDGHLLVNERPIRVFSERDPGKIPWGRRGRGRRRRVTGFFTDATKAAAHTNGGAKKVIISAPAKGEDGTFVLGVNESSYDPAKHKVISNASCTTNCVAPLAKVLDDSLGIEHGLMSTVHAYTNDQSILDVVHDDLRRARAAAMNIIPTSTGAAKAVGLVLPQLNGKLHGMAFRVPTSTVSLIDLVVRTGRSTSVEEVNDIFRQAADGALKGILQYCDEPLVSSDFKENPHSCIFDSLSTMVMEGDMVKVLGWYDNEWGYSNRIATSRRSSPPRGCRGRPRPPLP